MIITDAVNQHKLHSIVVSELKKAGLKHRLKKIILKNVKDSKTVFGAPLSSVPSSNIICCGSSLIVPDVVKEMCLLLKENAHIEGIFRKAGSQSRQKDIKRHLDSGDHITEGVHHPVDVASVLKLYLRALPEPLISADVQELLLRCRLANGDSGLRPLMHTLLLLPVQHVHLLHYVMEMLNFVSSRQKENLMNSTNLAIIMTPSVMPLPGAHSTTRLEHHVAIVKLLIENSRHIGILTEELLSQLDTEDIQVNLMLKKKKRRSGSLNRVLNGLRKMVSGSVSTPAVRDTAKTPILSKSAAKRKHDERTCEGFSAKTKKEIKNCLPQKELSFTPKKMGITERKKLRLSMTRRTYLDEGISKDMETSISSSDLLTSSEQLFTTHDTIDLSPEVKPDNRKDYVRISKQEYEEIKSRVSAIENRLSKEFTDVIPKVEPAMQVQNAYEKTLEDVAMLNCPSSDQLARRLSRELNIRQSDQHKIIRSPSARKIGTMRRRSKENERTKIVRHKSWNATIMSQAQQADADRFYPYVGLKKNKENIALPTKKNVSVSSWECSASESSLNMNMTLESSDQSYGSQKSNDKYNKYKKQYHSKHLPPSKDNSGQNSGKWKNAAKFFLEKSGQLSPGVQTGRPSVNKLRSQNAGAVLAKAKLFESASDLSSEQVVTEVAHTGFARKPRISGPQRTRSTKCPAPPVRAKIQTNREAVDGLQRKSDFKIQVSNLQVTQYPRMNNLQRRITSPETMSWKAPQNTTPAIKKRLCVKSPKSLRSPAVGAEIRKVNTPLRAAHNISPRRRSPRLKTQKSRP